MTHPRVVGTAALVVLFGAPDVAGETSKVATARLRIQSEFERLDSNRDGRLNREEFLQHQGEPSVLRRDFLLYDLDASGSLTPSEFASVSGLTQPSLRGRMPDPLDDLVLDAVVALDESYDRWNERPGELANAHTFVANFLGSISPGGKRFVTGRILRQADGDADGRMSRDEAKSFLQFQLGIRWHNGPPLREPTGRVVRFNRFIEMDRDQSNGLSHAEFAAWWPSEASVDQDFQANDRDGDGCITYLEYAQPTAPNYFDPIEWFRGADKDLDACLGAEELAKACDPARQHLLSSTISGFDDDDDGKLSLREYRLSMLANVNYTWETQPVDLDRDGSLSYDEFVFHSVDLFQLQRRYYFHRLDRSADGRLSLNEFAFKTQSPCSIYLRSADARESRLVYQGREYPQCGWPSVSPDGKQVLFHRCPPQDCDDGRIVVMDIDGQHLRDLCDGVQPSWSADGKQFVCARKSGGKGVWIISASALSGQRIADGWAPKWSPDGERIAYLNDNGVWVYDIRSRETREILFREDHPYQDLGDDIAWSPDGKQLALLGNQRERSELVILPDRGNRSGDQRPRVRCTLQTICRGNLNWTASTGIVFSIQDAATGRNQLVSVAADDETPPEKINLFDAEHDWKSACMTPDRKWYIAVSEN
jgi:dipeptidyl aminopeptidase/acylaminoacyl peptidase